MSPDQGFAPTPLSNDAPAKEVIIPAIGEDGGLYPIEKMRAHEEKRLHLAVSVFVFDGPKLLIQRRALGKYHCGGQWANTCCTHPHWGETITAAAHRRMQEELGLSLALTQRVQIDYSAAVTNDLHERERVTVFEGQAKESRLHLRLNPEEVCEIAWADVSMLRAMARQSSSTLTPWFRIYLNRWDELGLSV